MMARIRSFIVVGLALAALSIPAALARGEWYDDYEDAIASINSGEPGQAIELLERALARKGRSGYIRTYGNNYIRYVPWYYLGVAHHDAGDCEQSLAAFERSETAGETAPVPALATRLRALRSDCELSLAPTPEPQRAPAEPAREEPAPTPADRIDAGQLVAGLRAYLQGDLAGAVRSFEMVTRDAPEAARPHALLGTALYCSWLSAGEADEALVQRASHELSEAARLDPGLVLDPLLYPPRVIALYRSLR
jgi:tetratricopeptide (TPR) repeat protein